MKWLRGKCAPGPTKPRKRSDLVLEIVALRHQLMVLRRTGTRRPRFGLFDRLF